MEKIKEGQTVKFPKMKQTLVVAKILSEQYLEDYADIEFKDQYGQYHHYKNDFRNSDDDYYDGPYEIMQ